MFTILYGVIFAANLFVLFAILSKLEEVARIMRGIAADTAFLRRLKLPEPSAPGETMANDGLPHSVENSASL